MSDMGSLDHLPVITNPSRSPLEIEYFDDLAPPTTLYDNQGFTNFPERAGWDKALLLDWTQEASRQWTSRAVAAFLQQWLFFGLLSASMGHMHPMPDLVADFTRKSASLDRKVITTNQLERYLTLWRDGLETEQLQTDSETMRRLDAILDESQRHVARYMCRGGPEVANHPMRQHPDVSLSIMALGETITRAKLRIWPRSRAFGWQRSEIVFSRMTEAGWCPSDISMMEKLMKANGMYFASLLRPRMVHKNHVQAQCNPDVCNVMNISETAKLEYRTVHADDCDGDCEFEHIDEARLSEILQDEDALPVVKYETKPDGSFELDISAMKLGKDRDYVAISHVWAEGLGNTQNNALPKCQLRRIQALVTASSSGQVRKFWIDTLCVPQDNFKPHLKSLRLRAIQSMDRVYRSSSAVLVLDYEMLSTSSDASLEEQLVRFACCSWIRRLWTLQEAITGPKIMLQLSDTAIDLMQDIYQRLQNFSGFYTLSQTVLTELTDFLWRIVLLKEAGNHPRITALWNACQFRNTSEHQDEAFCLAIILGLDTRSILAASQEDKWQTFLLLQKTFPKDLLFSSGPRMSKPGFRWAPMNFIRRPATTTATLLLSMGTGQASSSGLSLSSHGFIFKTPNAAFRSEHPSFWILCQDKQKWYMVAHRTVKDDGQMPWNELRHALHKCDKLGIILNQDIDRTTFSLGVLVDLDHSETAANDECLHAGFMATVNVMLEQQDRWPILEQWNQQESSIPASATNDTCRVVVGTSTPPTQMWCVG